MNLRRLFFALALAAVVATGAVRHAAAAAPLAADDSYSVKEQAVSWTEKLTVDGPAGVLVNDSDPDNDLLVAVLVPGSDPTHGSLTYFNPDGSFEYVPDSNFTGTDSFQYVANDGQTDSPPATVTITVFPNTPPVANNDVYSVAAGGPLQIPAPGILGNDGDTDGDPLSVNGYSVPAHGDLVMNTDGSFTYTPDPGFHGQDGFGYSAWDGTSLSNQGNVASVTITVEDNPPVGVDDSYSTLQDTPLEIDAPGVLANDSDPDGDPMTAVLYDAPLHGWIDYLAADGSFRYVPDPGFSGVDSFPYQVFDGPQFAYATVTITVNPAPVNQAPVATDLGYDTDQDTPLTILGPKGVLTGASDPDGDAISAILIGNGAPNGGLGLGPDGGFTYSPNPGFFGDDSFQFQVTDGNLNSNVATVTIHVHPTGNVPPVASDDSYTVADDEKTWLGFNPGDRLLGNDSDANGDSLTAQLATGPAHGTLDQFQPNGSFYYTPAPGFVGDDSFTYQASDGIDLSNVATVTIHVIHNDPPVAVDDAFATAQNTPITIPLASVTANDSDPDGDPMECSSAWLIQPAHGTETYDWKTDAFIYSPDPGFVGTDTIKYVLWDGLSFSNDGHIAITVGDGGGTSTPTPDPSGTPDPGPTGTPTATPTDAPGGGGTETPVAGDEGDGSDDSDGGVVASGSGDDSGSDTGTAADDSDATPTAIARELPDTGGGPTGGDPSSAMLPAILLTIGLASAAYGVHRRSAVR